MRLLKVIKDNYLNKNKYQISASGTMPDAFTHYTYIYSFSYLLCHLVS